ncbi:uncharacterized protein K02A2.6-like [Entelurus aequoreus]|uniref:uncharacterized protein K02A2.6-like n=1 Tax=Entelurus aequoreus TaxID=161455 RepID=UPI002B1D68EF|nr:uncharacterized protein K02A2.6-like [Entelurus aequoreus]
MAGILGQMDAFDESTEQWSTYVERFEHFVAANGLNEGRKLPVFFSVMGPATYGLLRSLIAPEKPGTKTYDEVVTLLQAHFSPKPIVIAERYRFHKRDQGEGETITQYVTDLKKLSEHCEFGAYLQDALRDRLVCGLNSESIKKRLLTEKDLTYQRAVELAVSIETVARESQQLSSSQKVNAVSLSLPPGRKCTRCGRVNHKMEECFYKDQSCHNCGKRGHIARMCREDKGGPKTTHFFWVKKGQKMKGKFKKRADQVEAETKPSDPETTDSDGVGGLHVVEVEKSVKHDSAASAIIWVRPKVEGQTIEMELDTGAAVSIISEKVYNAKFSQLRLRTTNLLLRSYTGQVMTPLGVIKVDVRLNKQRARLPLYVVKGDALSLFGREWLRKVKLDWTMIKTIRATHPIQEDRTMATVLDSHARVFQEGLGTLKGFEVALTLKPVHQPKFFQARAVPYALRPKVEEELERLEQGGVLSPVQFSEWATPIVPILKKNGKVRICGDFTVTLNPALCAEHYPIPRIEDLFASLAGGQRFSKLDLANAYLQVPVQESSRKYLTITTQKGMFCYNRLPFGITSAPSIFQRVMDQVLQGLPNVHCFLDDILVTGENDADHLKNLDAVLGRLGKFGLRVQKEKCEFFKSSLEYLGHVIDKKGLHKSPEKLKAIAEAPAPINVSQLRSFLGLINYYGRFVKNMATMLSPLHELLHTGVAWKWSPECEKAFKAAKDHLQSEQVLTHYDPRLPLRIACDASPYGVGAVLSHVMPGGEERPIAFASRTLSKAEQNYAQIEREALGIIFGVRKFHAYLYGCHFTLLTDHRPLTSILSPSKATPPMAAARLQRWALVLAAHNYTIQYRKAADHGNADGLSRLPLQVAHGEKPDAVDRVTVHHLETLPVDSEDIRKGTKYDPVLSRVVDMVVSGQFVGTVGQNDALAPFYMRRDELTVIQGCLLWGSRVVVPPALRPQLLKELHAGHPGMVKMKAIARSHVWWPGLDAQIEQQARTCSTCQRNQKNPALSPLHTWPWPGSPWQRIHVDFAGPFEGHMFLVVVDAYSKWPEVQVMKTTTTEKTVQALRSMFARNGVPETLVSDNGPQFTAAEFGAFLRANGVKHKRSAPFHPATNGQAERFVQTLKRSLKASRGTFTLQHRVEAFLLSYRNAPHMTTSESPAMLFLRRRLRSRLDLVKPNVSATVELAQEGQRERRDLVAKDRRFAVGEAVLVRDYRRGEEKWMPGLVASQEGPVSYSVDVGAGALWRRHTEQMRAGDRALLVPTGPEQPAVPSELTIGAQPVAPPPSPARGDALGTGTVAPEPGGSPRRRADVGAPGRRYPLRVTRAPDRLNL